MRLFRDWKFAYSLPPTDFFAGSLSLKEFIEQYQDELSDCLGDNAYDCDHEIIKGVVAGLVFLCNKLKVDISDVFDMHTINLSMLPSGDCTPFWFLICKQNNNGKTYVVSPVRLPWLEE